MIKNIIFDFGGIIIDIFPERAINEFANIGSTNNIEIDSYFKENIFFKEIEIIPSAESKFINETKKIFKNPVQEKIIFKAWNSLLGRYNHNSIDIIKNAKLKFRTFLLSNTNQIHYDNFIPKFKMEFNYNLHDLFEKAYFSHQIGMRKPNANIFEYVLNDSKLIPTETIFIDDVKENRIMAEKLGIKTISINTNQGLINLPELRELIF